MDCLTHQLIGMQEIVLNILEGTLWIKSIQINYPRKRRNTVQKTAQFEGK
jgi:hypothetical protein